MTVWSVDVICPECGSSAMSSLVTSSTPTPHVSSRSAAIVRCGGCAREWQLRATIEPVADSAARLEDGGSVARLADRTPIRCGTERGYQRHASRRRRGHDDEPCTPCTDAHATFVRIRRQGQYADPNAAYTNPPAAEQQQSLFDADPPDLTS